MTKQQTVGGRVPVIHQLWTSGYVIVDTTKNWFLTKNVSWELTHGGFKGKWPTREAAKDFIDEHADREEPTVPGNISHPLADLLFRKVRPALTQDQALSAAAVVLGQFTGKATNDH